MYSFESSTVPIYNAYIRIGAAAAMAELELAQERERLSAARLEAAGREFEQMGARSLGRASTERLSFDRHAFLL